MSDFDFTSLRRQYRSLLLDGIAPFWLSRGIDWEYGGVFCSMDESGNALSGDKYIWSQARSGRQLAVPHGSDRNAHRRGGQHLLGLFCRLRAERVLPRDRRRECASDREEHIRSYSRPGSGAAGTTVFALIVFLGDQRPMPS